MNDNWKIYAHINKINNKVYVGVTGKELEERWKNGKNYKECIRFNNAITKYGWDSFMHVLIIDNLSKEVAMLCEIELIKKFKLINPKFGYNISIGGTAPMSGRKHSEKTLKKYSEQRIGENNSFYGKHHTQETITKLGRKVVCLNNGRVYNTISETGLQHVDACLNGREISAGKDENENPLFWMDYYEKLDIEKEYLNMVNNYPKLIRMKFITREIEKYGKIVCLNNEKIYDSLTECSEDLCLVDKQKIINICLKKKSNRSYKGYSFLFYDEYKQLNKEKVKNILRRLSLKSNHVDFIVCLNTKEEFNNTVEARKITNLKYGDTIAECAKDERNYGGEHVTTNEKLVWRYLKDYEKLSKEDIQYLIKRANPILIKCINDGNLFYSLKSASEYYNVIPTSISACCRKIYKSCGNGLKFEYYYNFVVDNGV